MGAGYDNAGKVDDEKLLQETGLKHYTAYSLEERQPMMQLGTINVATTERHTIRFENGGSGNLQNWDLIQFIPIDEDQVWPKVDGDGNWIYESTPTCEIFPYDKACPEENN